MLDTAYWRALNAESPDNIKRRLVIQAAPTFVFGITTVTVPGESFWLPLSLRFVLTTNATVANRSAQVSYQVGGTNLHPMITAAAVPASTIATYVLMYGYPTVATNGLTNPTMTGPLPSIVLEPGWNINLQIAGVVAGDTITNLELLVDEVHTKPNTPPIEQVSIADELGELAHAITMRAI